MPLDQVRIKKLKEERLSSWNEMQGILAASRSESRSMTADELQRWTALQDEVVKRGQTIETEERAAEIERQLAEPAPTPAARAIGGEPDEQKNERDVAYASAFDRYMRRGMLALNEEQRNLLESRFTALPDTRDQGTGSGAAGGYLVPQGFWAKVTETQKWYGGMLQEANELVTVNGEPMVWPSNDDTANVATIIGENTQVSEVDLTLGQNTISAFMYNTGSIRVSRQLLMNSFTPIEDLVGNRFGKRFGRGQNRHFTSGTGTGQPQGAKLFAAATGVSTVDYAGLIGLKFSVDPAYRNDNNACFMISDAALKSVMLLTDGAGRPLWIPAGSFGSLASTNPDTLLGSRVVVNNELDAPGAGNVPALFGDFKAGYVVRRVQGAQVVLRLEERYADYGQIGFLGFDFADGRIDDAAAVRRLQM